METCVSITKPKSSTVVCCHERELCGFLHEDDFIIITSDSVQLIWIASRLKERLDLERCVDLGVDDGIDKTVTILSLLATWNDMTGVVLAWMSMDGFIICTVVRCGRESQTDTSRNLIVRTSWEFETHMNVEILELIYVYNVLCQTEECPMRIMIAHRLTPFRSSRLRWQDSRQSRTRRAWSMLKRMVRYREDA